MSPIVVLYRFGRFFHRNGLVGVGKLISRVNRLIFGVWLPSSAEIGSNPKFGYWGMGIVIHSNAVIGNNVTIAQNVTVGRNFGDQLVPKIGNDVYVGTGSVIFGEIEIGDNVIIGANSVINKSIPANTTVVGNPFRVIQTNRTQTYHELDRVKD